MDPKPKPPTAEGRFFREIRMRGFQDRAEVGEVEALLDRRLSVLTAETVDLHEAGGRVLTADVIAPLPVPAFARAAMDGYALRGQETFGAGPYNPLAFAVVGEAMPGRAFTGTVAVGQAVRIMTGAPVPAGADAVLPAEAAEEREGQVHVSDAVPPGRNVGQIGEDVAVGTVVLRAGRLLRPQDIGVLASIGTAAVPVVRRPTVAVLITGDELMPCGSRPEGYRIVDSNSVMLEALIRRDGGIPVLGPIIPDRREAVRAALEQARTDVVLISGGSSVGQEDHAPSVVAELGELPVHGVALRPASPAGVGFLNGRPVFLMPGNPVSCLCAYDLFAGRAIRRMGGRAAGLPYPTVRLPLARKLVSAVGRVDYVRVLIRDGQVEPLATSGASILSSTTRADGFVLVPRDSEGQAAGEKVDVFLYDSYGAAGSGSGVAGSIAE
jgi:molybdopterin molybdotransferase